MADPGDPWKAILEFDRSGRPQTRYVCRLPEVGLFKYLTMTEGVWMVPDRAGCAA